MVCDRTSIFVGPLTREDEKKVGTDLEHRNRGKNSLMYVNYPLRSHPSAKCSRHRKSRTTNVSTPRIANHEKKTHNTHPKKKEVALQWKCCETRMINENEGGMPLVWYSLRRASPSCSTCTFYLLSERSYHLLHVQNSTCTVHPRKRKVSSQRRLQQTKEKQKTELLVGSNHSFIRHCW